MQEDYVIAAEEKILSQLSDSERFKVAIVFKSQDFSDFDPIL